VVEVLEEEVVAAEAKVAYSNLKFLKIELILTMHESWMLHASMDFK